MRLHTPLSILGITAMLALILGATVIAAPVSPPPGGYTGGIFSYYFKNIIEGNGTVGTTSGGVCPAGQVIRGFSVAPGTYGLPICINPTATDGGASSLTGSLRGTVNYLPKYGTTNTGIVNSQIFDNGANIGIGTTVPSGSIDISKPAGTTMFVLTNSTEAAFNYAIYNSGSSPINNETFRQGLRYGTTWNGYISFNRGASSNDGGMILGTSNTERMRITSNGNIGINTSNPLQRLTVVDSGNTNSFSGILNVYANNLTQGVGIGYMGVQAVGSTANQALSLNSKGTGHITMQISGSTGNVGIGTAAPGQKLQVSGDILTNNYRVTASVGSGVCFWNDCNQYKISMGVGAEYQYGPVTDYSIKMQMSGSTNRGFTWGQAGVAPIAALNNLGNMQIAGTMTAAQFLGNATTASGVPWTGVSGKPTTAAGYGITDVVTTAGNQTIAGTKTFSSAIAGSITGNAATATALQTARTINGVSFNGTANITLPTVDTTGDQTIAGIKTFNSDIVVNGNLGVGRGNNSLFANTRLGQSTLQSVTTGNFNTAIGQLALDANTSGTWNTAVGTDALGSNISGNSNTAYGLNALNTITAASNNTAIGWNAGGNLISGDNNIAIGASTTFPSTSGANQLNIGNWIYGSGGNIGIGTGTSLTAKLTLQGKIKIIDGTEGSGKVLYGDGNGLASWGDLPADLPVGTIMSFNSVSCPAGWAVADGTSGTPDLRGEFVRGWDPTSTIDTTTRWTNKTMTTTGSSVGSWQNATYIIQEPGSVAMAGGTYSVLGGIGRDSFQTHTGSWGINGVATSALVAYGGARYGFTVRPRNVALLYCMKMTTYTAPAPQTWYNTTSTASGDVALATTGDVGVGTTTPEAKLDVVGTMKITDGTEGTGKVLTSDGVGNATWQQFPGDLPVGTVMAFNSTSCPAGWAVANGTNGTPDLRGEFVRGLDSGRGVDTGRTLGSYQTGTHIATYTQNFGGAIAVQTFNNDNHGVGTMGAVATNYLFAGANNNYGALYPTYPVRPRNVALLYCMKISAAPGALSNSGTWVNVSGTSTGHVALGTSGNVGVGTTTPTEKLEVQGSIKVVDGNQGTGKVLISDANGKATWQEMPGDLPVGTIMSFNGASCPAGWVVANGTSGTPDLRGEFVRGLDSGRGVDTGRVLGTAQADLIKTHGHDISSPAGHTWGANYGGGTRGTTFSFTPSGVNAAVGYGAEPLHAGNWGWGYSTNQGAETRPRNVALLYCMKVTAAPPEISNNVTWMNVDGTSSGRVALATTGNVGIGNAAPTAKLDIVDATNMPATPAVNSIVPFKISNGTSEAILIDSNQIESVGGGLNLNFRPTTQNTTIAVGGGNVGIGTSGPLEKLSVDGGHMLVRSAFPTLYMMDTDHRSSAIHTNSNFLYFLTSPVDSRSYAPVANSAWPLILNLTNNDASFGGNVWAYGFYYISDKNLKKDIKKIESPLEKILKLNGYTFNWKDSGKADIGVIAQEVEQVFPELVAENKNAKGESYKTVQYGNLVAPIIEAIKELASQVKSLHALIEEQQSDIRKLKSENAELKARLDAIEARLAQ